MGEGPAPDQLATQPVDRSQKVATIGGPEPGQEQGLGVVRLELQEPLVDVDRAHHVPPGHVAPGQLLQHRDVVGIVLERLLQLEDRHQVSAVQGSLPPPDIVAQGLVPVGGVHRAAFVGGRVEWLHPGRKPGQRRVEAQGRVAVGGRPGPQDPGLDSRGRGGRVGEPAHLDPVPGGRVGPGAARRGRLGSADGYPEPRRVVDRGTAPDGRGPRQGHEENSEPGRRAGAPSAASVRRRRG